MISILSVTSLAKGDNVTVKLNLAATYGGKFYLPPVRCEAMYDFSTPAPRDDMMERWHELSSAKPSLSAPH